MKNTNTYYRIFRAPKVPEAYPKTNFDFQHKDEIKLACKPLKIKIKCHADLKYKLIENEELNKVSYYPSNYCSRDSKYLLPYYKIKYLHTNGKGSGSEAVRKVVYESLQNEKTQGRVILVACSFDDKSFPCGFYKKLGFKSIYKEDEDLLQKWLDNGANRKEAPKITCTSMYLPKENIPIALNYGLWDLNPKIPKNTIFDKLYLNKIKKFIDKLLK